MKSNWGQKIQRSVKLKINLLNKKYGKEDMDKISKASYRRRTHSDSDEKHKNQKLHAFVITAFRDFLATT